jgi:hypothetical protein
MCRSIEEAGAALEAIFPRLKASTYRITSRQNPSYNCVAWAACRDVQAYWQPSRRDGSVWPECYPLTDTVDVFVRLFGELGYVRTAADDTLLEPGVEKIAIYGSDHGYTFEHVAHQQADGTWTSKLGGLEDIEHLELQALTGAGRAYGEVACIMKRPRIIHDAKSAED